MTVLAFHDDAAAAGCAATVARHLLQGGVIAYPTETVYGFGSLLLPSALGRLAGLKGREESKPFLLLDADPGQLPGLSWTEPARLLARRFWPGPLSLALTADHRYPSSVRSPAGTVAVRDTPLPALRRLLRELAQPLTSSSANLPREAPATSIPELLEVLARLPGAADVLILDGGALPASLPSTVVDCSAERPRVLREGAVSVAELQLVLKKRGFGIDVG